ncbi:Transcriptional regulator, TetR family protein [Sandaracinus amylolyticus]|uniref:Transcriptional regulator, TetR family protein n=2 Tax=Sandaracinus amylolyticus TaxID=927083 RepID=A0A0F6W097_9BACT|nr:Transcriptional regulator, TetR family protein [Sandaracinus amylolyticus]
MLRAMKRTSRKAAPSKPPERAYHHGDLPSAMIEAALALIAEEGEDALSLRGVARRVGVDHSAAYRHFEDKRALLAAIAERGFRDLIAKIREAVAAVPEDDPPARLMALADAYVQFALDRPAHFRVMLGPRLNEDERFPTLEAAVGDAFGVLKSLIADGIARGALEDVPVLGAAGAVWSSAHGFAVLLLGKRIPIRRERVKAYMGEIVGPVVRGLERRDRPLATPR